MICKGSSMEEAPNHIPVQTFRSVNPTPQTFDRKPETLNRGPESLDQFELRDLFESSSRCPRRAVLLFQICSLLVSHVGHVGFRFRV